MQCIVPIAGKPSTHSRPFHRPGCHKPEKGELDIPRTSASTNPEVLSKLHPSFRFSFLLTAGGQLEVLHSPWEEKSSLNQNLPGFH